MIRALTLVLLGFTVAGCNGAGDAGDDGTASTGDATTTATVGESSTSEGTATATTVAETTGMTTAATELTGMTGSTSDGTTTTGDDTTTTGDDTTTTTTTTTGDTTGGEGCVEPDVDPDPKGASGNMCAVDAECGDGEKCFLVPLLGGICGECKVDADCPDGGCTLPNPLAGVGAVCNTGKPGSGCESDEVCDSVCNNVCAVALDATPIIKVSTCGACATSEDCSGGAICSPEVNLSEFSGINNCAAPGSLAQDETCSMKAGDEAACASGMCTAAAVMGVIKIGVCGACSSDADCDPGQTCIEAFADPETGDLFGSVCE